MLDDRRRPFLGAIRNMPGDGEQALNNRNNSFDEVIGAELTDLYKHEPCDP